MGFIILDCGGPASSFYIKKCFYIINFSTVSMQLVSILCSQIEDLQRLCQLGSWTPGHPENIVTRGIEV